MFSVTAVESEYTKSPHPVDERDSKDENSTKGGGPKKRAEVINFVLL